MRGERMLGCQKQMKLLQDYRGAVSKCTVLPLSSLADSTTPAAFTLPTSCSSSCRMSTTVPGLSWVGISTTAYSSALHSSVRTCGVWCAVEEQSTAVKQSACCHRQQQWAVTAGPAGAVRFMLLSCRAAKSGSTTAWMKRRLWTLSIHRDMYTWTGKVHTHVYIATHLCQQCCACSPVARGCPHL